MGLNTFIPSLAILSLTFAAVAYLCVWPQLGSRSFIPFWSPFAPRSHLAATPKDELEEALRRVSMENKTVIITVVNDAYADPHNELGSGSYPSMLDLFLESFWLGEGTRELLNHVLLVAVDQTAYERCKFRRLNCYRLGTDGLDLAEEKYYMSEGFIKMMWRRTLLLLEVLKRGYNFIFTDTDVMWLRNPLPMLQKNESNEDLQISLDRYNSKWTEKLMNEAINTGFYYIRSNNRTIALFETWYAMKDNSTGMKEQDVFVNLKSSGMFNRLGIRTRFLDTVFFHGFCSNDSDLSVVATVHANCCRGIGNKVADLTVLLNDWRRFKTLMAKKSSVNGGNGTRTQTLSFSKHTACMNSWNESNETRKIR